MDSKQNVTSDLAASLASLYIGGSNDVQISQMQHRLDIIAAWFGGLEAACMALASSFVFEIGCGQGDMTLALAHFVWPDDIARGKVLALDPAPLCYGSPFTLGQSQDHLSKTNLGRAIEWIRADPVEYVSSGSRLVERFPDYIVLAHSIFYLPSEAYFSDLLKAVYALASPQKGDKATMLLLSEWGMCNSDPAAEAHILAVKAQIASPIPGGNVRTVLAPDQIKTLAHNAGWQLSHESWLKSPSLNDGSWEVSASRELGASAATPEARNLIGEMELAVARHGHVHSMDVWNGVFSVAVKGT